MKKIGFIGTGVMGKSMVSHLIEAGYVCHVHNRTKEKAHDLIAHGAKWHDTIATLAESSDCIMTMVGDPTDVLDVYLSSHGILKHAKRGTLLIDFTTSKPALSVEIEQLAKAHGLKALDAPVSGGDIGAKNKTLTIMVGGDKDAFDSAMPLFNVLGKNIIRQGNAGAGQHTKMCNQITIASNMIGVCEAMLYAKKAGLSQVDVLKSITAGAAGSWSLEHLAPRMIKEDTAPGFYIKHFIKDMRIAKEGFDEMGISAPGLTLALKLYEQLQKEGLENLGTQALYLAYQ